MAKDSKDFYRSCRACQMHGNFIHQPPKLLVPVKSSRPFSAWGLDLIGVINPPSSKGHKWISAATDYFSKWAEAVPLREATTGAVADFIKSHIIQRFSIPEHIVIDN